jgi:hypothetical protein
MNAEKLFWLEQHCDGQGVYETPAPYDVPTRAEEAAGELAREARDREARHAAAAARELAKPTRRAPARICPGRAAVLESGASLRALAVALAEHESACLPCREDLARALLAAGAFGEVA